MLTREVALEVRERRVVRWEVEELRAVRRELAEYSLETRLDEAEAVRVVPLEEDSVEAMEALALEISAWAVLAVGNEDGFERD